MSAEIRALVVEDDPSWQQLLSEILADFGMIVEIAGSEAEAEEMSRSNTYRLAVLDLSLAGWDPHNRDGLRVSEAIRRHNPGCITLFLTGFATVELAVNLIQEHGAFSCLRKETFKRADFRRLISQALTLPPAGLSMEKNTAGGTSIGVSQSLPGAEAERRKELQECALVVEDEPGWRILFQELLGEADFKVHQSSSYVEALGQLKRNRFELAVVDLFLASSMEPEMNLDGYRLLATTHKANIPTIVVSGFADIERIERAYAEHKIFACLEKRAFDRETFIHTVEQARLSRAVISELEKLTERERKVLGLLAQGFTNKEIARRLFITTNTVKRHLKSIFEKLDVRTRAAASAKAISGGLEINV